MKKYVPYIVMSVVVLASVPLFAFADNPLEEIILRFAGIIQMLIVVAASLALLVFMWGIVKYIAAAGDEKSQVSAKNTMVYGVIGLFVLFSVFGIVEFLQESFDIDENQRGLLERRVLSLGCYYKVYGVTQEI
jgi:hypothetical protein